MDFSVVLARACNNVRGHVAILTETESTYVMIESTLRFDDVEDIPGLLPLLRVVQRSHMRSRERSGRRLGNEATWLPPGLAVESPWSALGGPALSSSAKMGLENGLLAM